MRPTDQALVKQAPEILPDHAIRELGEEDIDQGVVVREVASRGRGSTVVP